MRNIVDASSQRDLRDASVYDSYALPKLFIKAIYCISCAVHNRVVRVRSRADRKIRYTAVQAKALLQAQMAKEAQ